MQFVELDVEFGDGLGGDRQGEGTTVTAEELVQTAADAVIIERGELLAAPVPTPPDRSERPTEARRRGVRGRAAGS